MSDDAIPLSHCIFASACVSTHVANRFGFAMGMQAVDGSLIDIDFH